LAGDPGGVPDMSAVLFALQPTPAPTPTILRAPPADPLQTAGAIVAIVLALAAGFIGYRIIRGGRGL
ncbi:MAG TPA: FeoB-associated Cys-rich membrane protein, partial [Actinomycetota bacterium]|nr:FeoB-associated Cys-rich membrane protein [Actinomycetota bacterium]